jgi:glycosyltransferase involved in cell wall biosynthesis
LLVGNGINEQALKLQADTAKWKNIHFMNFQNQDYMPVLYQAADLFCLPSISETWGLSVNEAMACGKAVLVSDKVGCAADLVIPGDTGEIFESGNLADITSKLIALTKDKAALKVLGNNAKNKIADWSFVNQVAAMLRTFNTNHAS